MAVESDPSAMRVRKLFDQLLELPARHIINEVRSVNRSVIDITGKLPGTIEWE
jgi:GMP synthase PP-ATPase subunit